MPRGRKRGETYQKIRRPEGEELVFVGVRMPQSYKDWLAENDPLGQGNVSRTLQRMIKHAIWTEQEEREKLRKNAEKAASEHGF
jgi:hypothetical protein